MFALDIEPSTPDIGDVYMDDGTNTGGAGPKLRYYDGSNWINL
jgi:hypothetical protein